MLYGSATTVVARREEREKKGRKRKRRTRGRRGVKARLIANAPSLKPRDEADDDGDEEWLALKEKSTTITNGLESK